MKEPGIGWNGINMRFRRGSRDSVGSLYFQITFFRKKTPDPLYDARPLLEGLMTS